MPFLRKPQILVILFLAIGSVAFFAILLSYESTKLVESKDGTDSEKKEDFVFESDAAFGRALFFDKQMSLDRSISCADCHFPEKAFTDGKVKSVGVNGKLSFRNAGTLLNVKDAPVFMLDAHIKSLEEQAIVPIQDSNEMNISMGDLMERLQKTPHYVKAAKQLYQRDLDAWVLTRALAAFQRTLISNNSPFDQYLNGNSAAINDDAQKGWKLFNDFQCIECHSLPNFTNYEARNNGLYLDYGNDQGKYRIAGDSSLIGAFKVPTLRNSALTAPYMHDGSMNTMEAVLEHYSNGGSGHPMQDNRIRKRDFTSAEKNI